ncbi:hypothetical protein Palpr_2707 [Paludibacter propionicigenes WB4]|uniref:Uncharacterized protein n=1 Tax=Paludibacter propionicigenes (strain DSM 17365 / JCM 13257 / WB4) TaxID=694427 RepID=E4T7Z3_PALPW|nr:hypothetical protein Palpr_2707 [Paludibacter propionicigenes WB4]
MLNKVNPNNKKTAQRYLKSYKVLCYRTLNLGKDII